MWQQWIEHVGKQLGVSTMWIHIAKYIVRGSNDGYTVDNLPHVRQYEGHWGNYWLFVRVDNAYATQFKLSYQNKYFVNIVHNHISDTITDYIGRATVASKALANIYFGGNITK